MHRQYRYKIYLNANHSIKIGQKQGEIHPHTWEISMDMIEINELFTEFTNVEKVLENIIEPYQDKYINDLPPFNRLNPTLENITEYFKDLFEKELVNLGYILVSIEVSETPTRAFIINLTD